MGEHKYTDHLERNPQTFVPVLNIDGHSLTQSLAIIEYLNETRNLKLFPMEPIERAKVNALAHAIAVDIHPICNLSVSSYAESISCKENFKKNWIQKFMAPGLNAFEKLLKSFPRSKYCINDHPSIADLCLIPQIYNAVRWEVDISKLERINLAVNSCRMNPAFIAAHPDLFKPN